MLSSFDLFLLAMTTQIIGASSPQLEPRQNLKHLQSTSQHAY